jgi:protease-4
MSDGFTPPFLPPPHVPPPLPPASSVAPRRAEPPPKRGRGWLVFSVIVTTLLLVSLLANVFQSVGSALAEGGSGRAHGHASHLSESVLEDHDSSAKILVLDIGGVISGQPMNYEGLTLVDFVKAQLEKAADDENLKAIVLRMDSPGGEVLASDDIYKALRAFQLTNEIPVVTVMGSLAASGGYYISAASRWIVANELTITGSIGVIFHGYNYRELLDKVGVRPDVVKSGKLKDMFSGEKRSEDELPEEKSILNDMVAESFARFKSIIREGRGWAAQQNEAEAVTGYRELAPSWEQFADGRIMSGTTAHGLGLVDELGDFDTGVARALSLAGLKSANLVTYHTPPSLGDWFRFFGKSEVQTLRLEIGGLDFSSKLRQGRLYFMSPLHLH